jgi:hypothetical protein
MSEKTSLMRITSHATEAINPRPTTCCTGSAIFSGRGAICNAATSANSGKIHQDMVRVWRMIDDLMLAGLRLATRFRTAKTIPRATNAAAKAAASMTKDQSNDCQSARRVRICVGSILEKFGGVSILKQTGRPAQRRDSAAKGYFG